MSNNKSKTHQSKQDVLLNKLLENSTRSCRSEPDNGGLAPDSQSNKIKVNSDSYPSKPTKKKKKQINIGYIAQLVQDAQRENRRDHLKNATKAIQKRRQLGLRKKPVQSQKRSLSPDSTNFDDLSHLIKATNQNSQNQLEKADLGHFIRQSSKTHSHSNNHSDNLSSSNSNSDHHSDIFDEDSSEDDDL